jgi:hypothetical protein
MPWHWSAPTHTSSTCTQVANAKGRTRAHQRLRPTGRSYAARAARRCRAATGAVANVGALTSNKFKQPTPPAAREVHPRSFEQRVIRRICGPVKQRSRVGYQAPGTRCLTSATEGCGVEHINQVIVDQLSCAAQGPNRVDRNRAGCFCLRACFRQASPLVRAGRADAGRRGACVLSRGVDAVVCVVLSCVFRGARCRAGDASA